MSTKEQLININQSVFEKLTVDNPHYRYPTRGEHIGFYPSDKSLSPQKATLRATHDLFYALRILASPAEYDTAYTRKSIVQMRHVLETILDNINDLDPDIMKLISQFFDAPENKEFINKALHGNPLLKSMGSTQEEINDLMKLLYKNCQEFQEATPALVLGKISREIQSYYYDNTPIQFEFLKVLENNYGVSSEKIEAWKKSLKTNRDETLLEIKKEVHRIGLSRFGSDAFNSALEDARNKNLLDPKPVYSKRTMPNSIKLAQFFGEQIRARMRTNNPQSKASFASLRIISSKRLESLREKQKSLDIIYVLEDKDPKHRTKDILRELWDEYKKELDLNTPLDFDADYSHFFSWVDEIEKHRKIPQITYLNLEQQKLYKAEYKNNKITIFGGPADTSAIKGDKPGTAIYVTDNENNIYIAEKTKHEFQHSSFVSGKEVSCAGYIEIKKGKVISISNGSGHYKPDDLDLAITIAKLREMNVLDPKFVVVDSKFPFAKLGQNLIDTPGFKTISKALMGYQRKRNVNPDIFVQNVLKKYSQTGRQDTYAQAISYLDKAPAQHETQTTEVKEIVQSKRKPRVRWLNIRQLIKAKSSPTTPENTAKKKGML